MIATTAAASGSRCCSATVGVRVRIGIIPSSLTFAFRAGAERVVVVLNFDTRVFRMMARIVFNTRTVILRINLLTRSFHRINSSVTIVVIVVVVVVPAKNGRPGT